jgi:hypothetical protein
MTSGAVAISDVTTHTPVVDASTSRSDALAARHSSALLLVMRCGHVPLPFTATPTSRITPRAQAHRPLHHAETLSPYKRTTLPTHRKHHHRQHHQTSPIHYHPPSSHMNARARTCMHTPSPLPPAPAPPSLTRCGLPPHPPAPHPSLCHQHYVPLSRPKGRVGSRSGGLRVGCGEGRGQVGSWSGGVGSGRVGVR